MQLSDLGQNLNQQREGLKQRYRKILRPDVVLHEYSDCVDRCLITLWNHLGMSQHGLTLIAVGGYGRRELYPFSDMDVLVLSAQSPVGAAARCIEQFVQHLWDLNLEIGFSVHVADQSITLDGNNLSSITALTEARVIIGQRDNFLVLQNKLESSIDPLEYFALKRQEQQQRHRKYGNTAYTLEPNCKRSPGGLRDLHMMYWVASVAKLGLNCSQFYRQQLITAEEKKLFLQSGTLLKRTRIYLHWLAQRKEDRLLIEYQPALAEQMGYQSRPNRLAHGQLMQAYYRAAKMLSNLNWIFLETVESRLRPAKSESGTRIDDHFQMRHGQLELLHPNLYQKNPDLIFKTLHWLQHYPRLRGLTVSTMRSLWLARKYINAEFRHNQHIQSQFLALFYKGSRLPFILYLMNQLDLLGRYLPAFARIVGQKQYNSFHAYTVDEHTLQVMTHLHRFTTPESMEQDPLCFQLMRGFSGQWHLFLAVIYHDIGKGRGHDHSIAGAQDALRFCKNHGLSAESTELIVFLVRHHLTLSDVAQRKDLSDYQVIQSLAQIVMTPRRLIALYLLTIADIRGTHPEIWNNWKGKLLQDCFYKTLEVVQGNDIADTGEIVADRLDKAQVRLDFLGLDMQRVRQFWNVLDESYFIRHDVDEIVWEARHISWQIEASRPVVRGRLQSVGTGIQVVTYLKDSPLALKQICAYFSKSSYNILDAKIHLSSHGYLLGTFQVMAAYLDQKDYRTQINLIEYGLNHQLAGIAEMEPVQYRSPDRRARLMPIRPKVRLIPSLSNPGVSHLTVIATDRPQLLFQIVQWLAQQDIRIHTAKIITLGLLAEDVFMTSSPEPPYPDNADILAQELTKQLACV